MKKKLVLLLFVFVPLISSAQKTVKLFNGKNLKKWEIVLKENVSGAPVFYVADGLLNVSGNPFGYIRTKKSFENYELTLEWRWEGEPINSGVLLNISGEDTVWPHCIEAQLMNQNAGDLVLMQIGAKAVVNNEEYEIQEGDKWFKSITKQNTSYERAPGEWNRYRIISYHGRLDLYINDVLHNSANSVSPNNGYIGLQSEGSHIQFRNIYLKKIK